MCWKRHFSIKVPVSCSFDRVGLILGVIFHSSILSGSGKFLVLATLTAGFKFSRCQTLLNVGNYFI